MSEAMMIELGKDYFPKAARTSVERGYLRSTGERKVRLKLVRELTLYL